MSKYDMTFFTTTGRKASTVHRTAGNEYATVESLAESLVTVYTAEKPTKEFVAEMNRKFARYATIQFSSLKEFRKIYPMEELNFPSKKPKKTTILRKKSFTKL